METNYLKDQCVDYLIRRFGECLRYIEYIGCMDDFNTWCEAQHQVQEKNEDVEKCIKYTALDVAQHIINKCVADHKYITNCNLQRILYLIQMDRLAHGKEPLFDDSFQAWGFGPCIPEVYYYFCGYGSMPISGYCRYNENEKSFEKEDLDDIDGMTKMYRKHSCYDLIDMCCKPSGAWSKIYKGNVCNRQVIPVAVMREEAATWGA